MKEEQGYYMVIPATVWDSEISERSILLYGHISTLVKKEGYCWANNEYFENKLRCSLASVKRCLVELEKAKLIYRELVFKEGTKEVESRKIYLNLGRITGEPRGRSNNDATDLNLGRFTGDYTENDENDENLGRFTGDPDNSTRVLLDSTNIEDNKVKNKVSYSSYSSTPRTEETEESPFLKRLQGWADNILEEDSLFLNKLEEKKKIEKTKDLISNKSIFDHNPIFSQIDKSKALAKKDSIDSDEAHSASEKEVKVRQGCKPLEYIPTDKERWASAEETKERAECNSILDSLLEIWPAPVLDKEECLFGIFKLDLLDREDARLALNGRVKFNNFKIEGKNIESMDDFIQLQVRKSEYWNKTTL